MPPQDLATYYFTQGVLGVTVIVLAIVCVKLYNKLQEVQEARLTDSKATIEKVVTVLENNTQSNNLLAQKIETGRGRSA